MIYFDPLIHLLDWWDFAVAVVCGGGAVLILWEKIVEPPYE